MAVPSPSPPAKDDLRRAALARRRAFATGLDAGARLRLEGALARTVLPHLATARTIAVYHPLASEIGPAAIMAGLAPDQRAVFPWFAARDSAMLFRAGPALEPGPWGILQPGADAPAHDPDLLLVPLVLADRAGTRIGHGQGHYDRALVRLAAAGPVTAIGLGWACQLVDGPLPADPWDARLDAVATPEGWFPCR
jgi:5-formyltetrahydrofolate cyclo-ligase